MILLVSLVLNKEISFPLDQFRVDPTYLITELLNTKLVTTTASYKKNNSNLTELISQNISKNFSNNGSNSTFVTTTINSTENKNETLKNNSNFKHLSLKLQNFYFILFFRILHKFVCC